MVTETQKTALKKRAGRRPFDARMKYSTKDRGCCPIHGGDNATAFCVLEENGIWLGTCFTDCAKTWDVIAFVMAHDKVPFLEAVRILEGKGKSKQGPPIEETPAKPKAKAMTPDAWEKLGREVTQDDINRLATNRTGLTPSVEIFRELGFRVGTPPHKTGDWLVFPFVRTDSDGTHFDLVKYRKLDEKDFDQQNVISGTTFGNLDTIGLDDDVFVVEGEVDLAVMEAAGFHAVTVNTGSQRKFDPDGLRCLMYATRIFLIGDQSDRPGDPGPACMDALQKQLEEAGAGEKVFRIHFDDAHDVSELAKVAGASFRERIIELRDSALEPWIVKNIPTVTELPKESGRWVIDRIIPYGGLVMVSGEQGSLKSFFAQFAGKAVAWGGGVMFRGRMESGDQGSMNFAVESVAGGVGKFLGRDVMRGVSVLYIDRENALSTVNDRIEQMGIMGNKNYFYWGDFNRDNPTPEPDDPRLLEFVRQRNALVIFDSLQDWYGDASEIDNTAMVELVGKFRRLARAGAGVLLLHHFDKNFKKPRGGTSITALTDMSMKSTKEGRGEITLSEDRFRMCDTWEIKYKVHFDGGVLPGESDDLAAMRAHHIYVELVSDKNREEMAAEKEAEGGKLKSQQDRQDCERVIAHIKRNLLMSPRQMEDQKLGRDKNGKPRGMRENRIKKLAALDGWAWNKAKKIWHQFPVNEPPHPADDPDAVPPPEATQ